jgi:uncharacterized protein (TIGR03437 family)
VKIGGMTAEFFGAALASGFAGLYQIAVRVPSNVADGDQPVVATIEGVSSPTATILAVKR